MISTILIVMAIYFLAMIAISWKGRKYASDFTSYLNTGRTGGILLLMGGCLGAQIGNGLVVGGAEQGSMVGLAGIAYAVGCALSFLATGLIINDMVYNGNYMSLGDYLKERYHSDIPTWIYNITTVLCYIGGLASQLMAGKALFEALGLNGVMGVVIIAVVVFLYSQISGYWGAMATSVVQIGVIIAGLFITLAYLMSNGAWDTITSAVANGTVPPTFTKLSGYNAEIWLMMTIPACLSSMTDQVGWQRINAAKSAKAAKVSAILSVFVLLPIAVIPVIIGMYGTAAYGATGTAAFFTVIFEALPPILAALMVAAVVAAVMSTIDGCLIAFSAIILKDIYKGHINKSATDKQLSKMTLGLNVIVITLGILLAISSSSIIGLMANTYIFLCAACLVPFLGGWLWKKATTAGAVSSSIVGVIFALLQFANIYTLPYSAITIFVPSLIAFVIVSLMTQKKA